MTHYYFLQVLVPVANGSEAMEVVTPVDVLRRAKMNVVVASVEKSNQIIASQNINIVADTSIMDASRLTYDLIILPVSQNLFCVCYICLTFICYISGALLIYCLLFDLNFIFCFSHLRI